MGEPIQRSRSTAIVDVEAAQAVGEGTQRGERAVGLGDGREEGRKACAQLAGKRRVPARRRAQGEITRASRDLGARRLGGHVVVVEPEQVDDLIHALGIERS